MTEIVRRMLAKEETTKRERDIARNARRQQQEGRERERERERYAQNKARLVSTGIVSIFEELCAGKDVTLNKDKPAEVTFGNDGGSVTLTFDEHTISRKVYGCWTDFIEPHQLKARLTRTGALKVGRRYTREQGEELGEVVGKEILRLKNKDVFVAF